METQADRVKVIIYAWKQYANDKKHQYVKILLNGKVVAENGSANDRNEFFSITSAVAWANKYLKETFPDVTDIEFKGIGEQRKALYKEGRYIYCREGD